VPSRRGDCSGSGDLRGELLLLFDRLVPDMGNMPIELANVALESKGMSLVATGRRFRCKGGMEINLLQEHDCRLIVHVMLEDHEGNTLPHFVAFDGRYIADRPHPENCSPCLTLRTWSSLPHVS
jgi:hypothetical protein